MGEGEGEGEEVEEVVRMAWTISIGVVQAGMGTVVEVDVASKGAFSVEWLSQCELRDGTSCGKRSRYDEKDRKRRPRPRATAHTTRAGNGRDNILEQVESI